MRVVASLRPPLNSPPPPCTGLCGEDGTNLKTGLCGEDGTDPKTGLSGESSTDPKTGLCGENSSDPKTGLCGEDDTNSKTGLCGEDGTNPKIGLCGEHGSVSGRGEIVRGAPVSWQQRASKCVLPPSRPLTSHVKLIQFGHVSSGDVRTFRLPSWSPV
ncbi:hypothetical protein RRG08_038864 [Elysia crispata]|uniref:Uncharacterized protein n=1 Tax=Elysia crispata TaxID=231223 RepID=A0AAE1D4E1_9GAST|nr:hypothetical protein RRG08_038864 [Elysia crispata]